MVTLEAREFQFSPASVAAPAGMPFTIAFSNRDVAIPHNVTIRDATGAQRFAGKVFIGPGTVNYNVPALAAGTYTLGCAVHPDMRGTITAD